MMASLQEVSQSPPVIDPRAREWADSVSLIPIEPKGKKPLIQWKEFTTRRATREERAEWKKRFPGCNWGLVCGEISGVVALDFDGPEGKALFNEHKVAGTTPVNVTGKGFHALYQVPDRPLKNGVRIVDGLDIRSDDGYVVCPPSTHPSGTKYQWQLPPWVKPPPPVPDWIWPLVEAKTEKEAAENSPGYVESPIPPEKATSPHRPKLYKTPPKPKKARGPRLLVEEIQRREKVRQEWAAEEFPPAE